MAMTPALSDRSLRISRAGAIQVMARARELESQGVDIIHLEIGELDFDTPAHIVEAGVASLRNGRTRYASTEGTPSLREAIADYVNRTRETAVSPQHVIATPGVKGAIYFAIMGLIEAGDEVIVPDPGFPAYGAITSFAGGIPVPLPLRKENGFFPDLDELRSLVSNRTKMLILNNPGNPTGAVLPLEILETIAEIALEHNLWIVSDEIYAQLHFNDSFPPSIYAIHGMAERTILMDGFSKAYAMTGWRLGFAIFPEKMTGPVLSMMVNDHSCLPLFVQDAGEAALRGPQDCVAAFRDELRLRRDLVVDACSQIPGIDCSHPDGAFYAMIEIGKLGGVTAVTFTDQLLMEGVALLPGSILGKHGQGQVRLAYTVARNQLEIGLARIANAVKRLTV